MELSFGALQLLLLTRLVLPSHTESEWTCDPPRTPQRGSVRRQPSLQLATLPSGSHHHTNPTEQRSLPLPRLFLWIVTRFLGNYLTLKHEKNCWLIGSWAQPDQSPDVVVVKLADRKRDYGFSHLICVSFKVVVMKSSLHVYWCLSVTCDETKAPIRSLLASLPPCLLLSLQVLLWIYGFLTSPSKWWADLYIWYWYMDSL